MLKIGDFCMLCMSCYQFIIVQSFGQIRMLFTGRYYAESWE